MFVSYLICCSNITEMRGQSSRWSGGRSGSGRGRGGRGGRGVGLDDIPEANVVPAPAPARPRVRARALPEGQRQLCTPDIRGYVFNINYLILII